MPTEIVDLMAHRQFLPSVAEWIWLEWAKRRGTAVGAVLTWLGETALPERRFVLVQDGAAIGTASLVQDDLATRPELSPWMASVFVAPTHRGRGHAVRLVRHVEAAASVAGVPTLWLHTEHASGLYEKLGWQVVGPEDDEGYPVTLMRRDL